MSKEKLIKQTALSNEALMGVRGGARGRRVFVGIDEVLDVGYSFCHGVTNGFIGL